MMMRGIRIIAILLAWGLVGGTLGCLPADPLPITPTELANAVQGQSYEQYLSAEGEPPLQWSLIAGSLPGGLTLDAAAGALTGTPTESGAFSFTLQVRDASFLPRTGTIDYLLTVIAPLSVDSSVPVARVGESYSHTIPVQGGIGPYDYTLIGLPAGLAFDESTGTISGTPVVAKSQIALQIGVTDSGDPQQSVTADAVLTVKPQSVRIVTTSLSAGQVNVPYSAQLEATNGAQPYSWAVITAALPGGLRLNVDTGMISGEPLEAGVWTFTVRVTDSDSPAVTDTQDLILTIEP